MKKIITFLCLISYCFCNAQSKRIYLTFDDGPSLSMDTIMTTLGQYGVKGTFFVKGANCDSLPNVIKRAVNEGHLLGCHSNKHPYFTSVTSDSCVIELKNSVATIKRVSGMDVGYFRFPYFAFTTTQKNWIKSRGLTPVLTSIDPYDWDGTRSAARIIEWIVDNLNPSSANVVTLHTIPDPINSGVNYTNTNEMLPQLILDCRALGYEFYLLDKQVNYNGLSYTPPTN